MQIYVADELTGRGLEQRRDLTVGADGREDRDLVIVARLGQARIALPVLRQAQAGRTGPPLHQQQLVEVQQRIGQQRFAAQGDQGRVQLLQLRGRLIRNQLDFRGQLIQTLQVPWSLGECRSKGRHEIADRQLQGGDLHFVG